MTLLELLCSHLYINPNTLTCELCGMTMESIVNERDLQYRKDIMAKCMDRPIIPSLRNETY